MENSSEKNFNINLLKKHRKAKGITQTFMAKQLGYKSTSGYSNIESGKTTVSLEVGYKISKLLNQDIETLFFE